MCENNYLQNIYFRLEIENDKLKVTIKKQAHKIEQLQTNLLGKNSVSQSLNFHTLKMNFYSLVVVYKIFWIT